MSRITLEQKAIKVADDIRNEIASGIFKPGDVLATSLELMSKYSVSVNVIQRARDILKAEGTVHIVRDREGIRTVVS